MDQINNNDFRERFSKLADQALVTRFELAALLATTAGAVSQMAYRGELPKQAFPEKRRACWFARDIREWLNNAALNASADKLEGRFNRRLGRKRISTGHKP